MKYEVKFLITANLQLEKAERVSKVQNNIDELDNWITDFIGECDTLFNILEDEGGCFGNNIYVWRNKYTKMESGELDEVFGLLVEKFLKWNYEEYEIEEEELEDKKVEIIDIMKQMISVSDITNKFQLW